MMKLKKLLFLLFAMLAFSTAWASNVYVKGTQENDIPFTTDGDYYISNKWTGKYVKLENSQLATVTAENKAQADIITMAFNDNGSVTTMKQKNGDGDMIATLNFIKESFETHLTAGDYPIDFLDQMFTMKMIYTGDDDGSVYLVVDVPVIENWEGENGIKNYLISHSQGNQAVNFYLSHMVPGNRHYLCVDSDDTFGFTLDNGTASKWLVYRLEKIPIDEEHFPDPVFRQFVYEQYDKNNNWWLSQAEIDKVKMLNLWTTNYPECVEITSLQGIEYFENMSCINVKGLVNVTSIDLSQNKEKLDSVWLGLGITSIDVSQLTNMTDLRLDDCASLLKSNIDLSNNNKLKLLSLKKSSQNIIKGLNGKKTLRYLNAEGNRFENDTLNLENCTNLYYLDVIDCKLYKLVIKGCTSLGYNQENRAGAAMFGSNRLSSIDLTGITCPSSKLYSSGNLGQIKRHVKPEVALIDTYHQNGQVVKYRYCLYLRLWDEDYKPSYFCEEESSILESLVNNYFVLGYNNKKRTVTYEEPYMEPIRFTDFELSRVPEESWKYKSGQGQGMVMVIHGTMQNNAPSLKVTPVDDPDFFDPDAIPGDVLTLGLYDVLPDEWVMVNGVISYTYDTGFEGTLSHPGVPARDAANYPFELGWYVVLTGDPSEVVTGVSDVNLHEEVSKVTYVNMMGIESERPFEGVNIVVTRYTDGSVTTTKVIR